MAKKGQKPGKKTPISKESLMEMGPVHKKMRKISKAMFGRKMPMDGDAAMRAQMNG